MFSARPLRLWLALRIMLAGLVPLAVVAALILGVLLPQLRADLEIHYQTLARAIAGQIEIHLLGAERELRAVAEDLRNHQRGLPASHWFSHLDAHAETGYMFAAIYIIDSDDSAYSVGLPQAERHHRDDLLGLDLSKWAVLREARERNEAVWSEAFLSAATGQFAVALAIPVAEHTLVGEIAIDRLSEFIGRSPAESGIVTMILDRQGQIIAHSRAALNDQQPSLGHLPIVRDAPEGRFATRSFEWDGERFVGIPVTVPQLDWIVLVAQPRSEAFRPFLSTLWVLVAGVLVALPLATLVAWGLARGFARRIGRYAEQAHAIAEGDYDEPWPISRIREFDGLAGDLDRMSLAIRQRERDLATSEARFRSVIGNAPVVLFQFDERGIFTFSEGKGLAGIGRAAGEAVGRSVFELYRDYPEICDYARRTLNGESVRFNTRIGEVFLDVYANPVRAVDGSFQVIGVTVDITERQRAEEARRESEARLRAAIESIPFDFFLIGVNGRYALQNSVSRKHWGDVVGKCPDDVTDDAATLAHWNENNRKALAGQIVDEEVRVTIHDEESFIHNIIAPIEDAGEIRGIVGLNIDITDRRRSEEALRQANLVVENSPVMLFRWKAEDGWPVAFVSHNVKQLGYSPGELLDGSFHFISLVYHEDLERICQEVRGYSERGVDQFQQEYRIVAKDGTVRWIDDRVVVERNAEGEVTHYQGIVIDITERKRVEEALRQSRNLLQTVLDTIPARVFWKDRHSRYLGCNRPFALDAGVDSPDEMVGRDDYQMGWWEQADLYRSDDKRVLESGKSKLDYEEPQATPDGRHIWLRTSKVPLRDADGVIFGILGTYQDITAHKQAEEAIRRTNRQLRMLSDCNQALIRTTDEMELLTTICTIVVQEGGYRMAWVGYAEQDASKTIRPIAHAGFEDGYLQYLNITWVDDERGLGPMGTAIRTGRPSLVQNIASDSRFAPWRAEAAKRDYAAACALPLTASDQIFGALGIYSSLPDAFDAEEIDLLSELANDLAFGIAVLRARLERERADAALKESEFFLRRSQEVGDLGSYYFDARTGTWISSEKLDQIFGIDDAFPKTTSGWIELVHPDDKAEMPGQSRYVGD